MLCVHTGKPVRAGERRYDLIGSYSLGISRKFQTTGLWVRP